MKVFILVCLAFCLSIPAQAQTAASTETSTSSPTTSTQATTSSQPNINQSANQGNSSQMLGAGISGAVGAGLLGYYFMNDEKPTWAAMMGAMALLQAVQSGLAAGQSGNTGDAASWNGLTDPYGTTGVTPAPLASAGTDGLVPGNPVGMAQVGLQKLAAAGVSVDPAAQTVTADGVTQPFSAFSSPAGMAAAGMTPSQIATAQSIIDKAIKDAKSDPKVIPVPVDGGAGGYSETASNDNSANNFLAGLRRGLSSAEKKKILAGKTRVAGGAVIGVQGDDIFQMIHRAYEIKRHGNEFIEVSAAARVAGASTGTNVNGSSNRVSRAPATATTQPGFIIPKH